MQGNPSLAAPEAETASSWDSLYFQGRTKQIAECLPGHPGRFTAAFGTKTWDGMRNRASIAMMRKIFPEGNKDRATRAGLSSALGILHKKN